jgi:hypothetical protein
LPWCHVWRRGQAVTASNNFVSQLRGNAIRIDAISNDLRPDEYNQLCSANGSVVLRKQFTHAWDLV